VSIGAVSAPNGKLTQPRRNRLAPEKLESLRWNSTGEAHNLVLIGCSVCLVVGQAGTRRIDGKTALRLGRAAALRPAGVYGAITVIFG
jgi:hypothetical protein